MKINQIKTISLALLLGLLLQGCSGIASPDKQEELAQDKISRQAAFESLKEEFRIIAEGRGDAATMKDVPREEPVTIQVETTSGAEAITGVYDQTEAYRVLELVNDIRINEGLHPLRWDERVEEGAMLRAAECQVLFSHTRPNGQQWSTVNVYMKGENIAQGRLTLMTAEEVVDGWMNSPGHKENILRPEFQSMGVSLFIVDDPNFASVPEVARKYATYNWAQNFNI